MSSHRSVAPTEYQKQFLDLTFEDFVHRTNIVSLVLGTYVGNGLTPANAIDDVLHILHRSLRKTSKWNQCQLRHLKWRSTRSQPRSEGVPSDMSQQSEGSTVPPTDRIQQLCALSYEDFVGRTNLTELIRAEHEEITDEKMQMVQSTIFSIRKNYDLWTQSLLHNLRFIDGPPDTPDIELAENIHNSPARVDDQPDIDKEASAAGARLANTVDDGQKPSTSTAARECTASTAKDSSPKAIMNKRECRRNYIPTEFQLRVAKMSLEQFRAQTNVDHIVIYGPDGYLAQAPNPNRKKIPLIAKKNAGRVFEHARKPKLYADWIDNEYLRNLRPIDAPDAFMFGDQDSFLSSNRSTTVSDISISQYFSCYY